MSCIVMSVIDSIPQPEPFVWQPGQMISNIERSVRENHHSIDANYTFLKLQGYAPLRDDIPYP